MKLKQLPGMLLAAMLVMSSVPFPVSAADIGGTEVLEEKADSPAGETSGDFSGDLTGDDTVFGMIENELVEEEADAVFTEEEADAVFTEEEGDAAFEEETADDAVNDGSAVDPAADPDLSVDGAAAEPDASTDDATDDREDEPDIGGAAADDEEDEPVIDEAAADDEDVEPVIGEAAADEKTIEADKADADFLSDTVQDSVTEDTAEDALYSGGETETPEYPISGPEPGGEIVASGTCDENLTWSLDAEGTLTISGIGEMTADPAPWNEKADDIKKVIIESGVISIGDYAFFTCRNLKSISIADSVHAIGEGAFAFCTNLADITIPDHVASISCRAFTGCESLTSITIPYGVKDIEDYTFCECTSLTSITIPNTVKSVGDGAFDDCSSLTDVYYQGTEESWNNINISDRNEDLLNAYIIFLGEKNLKNASVTGLSAKTYNGRAIIQSPVVKYNGETLTEGNDYTVSYKNNTHVGTAKVTFTGKGGYTGVRTETFRINKAEQPVKVSVSASPVSVGDTAAVKVSGAKGDVTYKTSSKSIATVSSTGTIKGVKVGKAQITVNFGATSDFNPCSKTVTIKIVPAATASITAANQPAGIRLTWKKVAGANAYFIFRDGTQIAAIRDGSVTYTDKKANTNGAKYVYKIITSASVTGRSTHSTSVTTYRMDRPAISSLTNSGTGRLTAKWGKNAKATGYQIHYCPDKTFETGNKSATISGASTVTKTIAGLTKGKTYYVRIRTFKTVGSTKYFSAWSTVRSVKIAK